LTKFFPDGNYPEGEIQEYKDEYAATSLNKTLFHLYVFCSNAWRTTSEEKRYDERQAMESAENTYQNIRRAAEVHRLVRKSAKKYIKPGMTMTHIAEFIEDGTRALVEENGLEAGIGFPTGLSLNHCAAHYTPNPGDNIGIILCLIFLFVCSYKVVLKDGDVLKVDFGVQVKGRIVDSAFTIEFGDKYGTLLKAVKAATNTGIRVSYHQ
jgi:methionyl aminopeptidase